MTAEVAALLFPILVFGVASVVLNALLQSERTHHDKLKADYEELSRRCHRAERELAARIGGWR